MDQPSEILDLPRSVLLALWLPTVGRRSDDVRRALRAVQGDDEPHSVNGHRDGGVSQDSLSGLLGDWAAGRRDAAALLPVPGDVSGLPPGVADNAVDAQECVLVHAEGRSWAAVPEVVAFGTVLETGHVVTWTLTEVPDWRLRLPGVVGTLSEAEQALRDALAQATEALSGLDVARWRPDAAETIASLRSEEDPGWPLPVSLPPRALRVLVTAVRLRAIVALATADDGGAVNLWQADQRSAALRQIDHAARRAIAAATLAAGAQAGGGQPGPQEPAGRA